MKAGAWRRASTSIGVPIAPPSPQNAWWPSPEARALTSSLSHLPQTTALTDGPARHLCRAWVPATLINGAALEACAGRLACLLPDLSRRLSDTAGRPRARAKQQPASRLSGTLPRPSTGSGSAHKADSGSGGPEGPWAGEQALQVAQAQAVGVCSVKGRRYRNVGCFPGPISACVAGKAHFCSPPLTLGEKREPPLALLFHPRKTHTHPLSLSPRGSRSLKHVPHHVCLA